MQIWTLEQMKEYVRGMSPDQLLKLRSAWAEVIKKEIPEDILEHIEKVWNDGNAVSFFLDAFCNATDLMVFRAGTSVTLRVVRLED